MKLGRKMKAAKKMTSFVLDAAQEDIRDPGCDGLWLRVSDAGLKTWSFAFTIPGTTDKRSRHKLGVYKTTGMTAAHDPIMGLAQARDAAAVARKKVAEGINPNDPVVLELQEITVGQLFEKWMAHRGPKSGDKQTRSRFKNRIGSKIGHIGMSQFQINPHYIAVTGDLIDAGKKAEADAIYKILRGMFQHAFSSLGLKVNEMLRPESPYTYKAKERWLTPEEIRTLWHLLPQLIDSPAIVTVIRLLIATGQRSDNVCAMTLRQIDLDNKLWTIPKTKGEEGEKLNHEVPLNDVAMALVREAIRGINDPDRPLFLAPQKKTRRLTSGDICDKIANVRALPCTTHEHGIWQIAYWTAHTLRHSVATNASLQGVTHEYISLTFNHSLASDGQKEKQTTTQKVYIHDPRLPEKWAAMRVWGAFLAKVIDKNQPLPQHPTKRTLASLEDEIQAAIARMGAGAKIAA